MKIKRIFSNFITRLSLLASILILLVLNKELFLPYITNCIGDVWQKISDSSQFIAFQKQTNLMNKAEKHLSKNTKDSSLISSNENKKDSYSQFRNLDPDIDSTIQGWIEIYKSYLSNSQENGCNKLANKNNKFCQGMKNNTTSSMQQKNSNDKYSLFNEDFHMDAANNYKNRYKDDAFIETNTVNINDITTINCGFGPEILPDNNTVSTIDCGYTGRNNNITSTDSTSKKQQILPQQYSQDNNIASNNENYIYNAECLDPTINMPIIECEKSCEKRQYDNCRNKKNSKAFMNDTSSYSSSVVGENQTTQNQSYDSQSTESSLNKADSSSNMNHTEQNIQQSLNSVGSGNSSNGGSNVSSSNQNQSFTNNMEIIDYNTISMDSINMYDINKDMSMSESQSLSNESEYKKKKTEKKDYVSDKIVKKDEFKALLKGTAAYRKYHNRLKLKSDFEC